MMEQKVRSMLNRKHEMCSYHKHAREQGKKKEISSEKAVLNSVVTNSAVMQGERKPS